MASLHSALQVLGPTPFSSLPTEESQAQDYLRDVFTKAQLLVDSIPLPPADELAVPQRARSNTVTSSASNVSEISISSARSDPINPANVGLQKEWGKPIKLAAKDNPLGIAVYKLSGKDGKGAWFARRSVHEGLGFRRWKLGFEREFPESLAVQGGPGEGNVRGIGGERRVEQKAFHGVGKVEVYHLSAQFPGPTTPRDFVTLLMTSDSALDSAEKLDLAQFGDRPRHYMIVSKPCLHPDCPPRDGYIRGQYESVEFIREIRRKPKRSYSTADLRKAGSETSAGDPTSVNGIPSSISKEGQTQEARRRSQTISFTNPAIQSAETSTGASNIEVDGDAESNPVEWIMITRSDPGGSVPRFMVERGTPGSIVTDASKFLDWACKKDHDAFTEKTEDAPPSGINDSSSKDLEAYQTNGHLAGLDSPNSNEEPATLLPEESAEVPQGVLANMARIAKAGIESYAPQVIADQLRAEQSAASAERVDSTLDEAKDGDDASSLSSMTFASAKEGYDDDGSAKSMSSHSGRNVDSPDQSRYEQELAKLHARKKALDEKLAKSREKELKDKEELTSKEQDRLRKAEEKHKRDVEKQELKYKKEVAKLEARRTKETVKEEARKKKELDKDEKARLTREKEATLQELEVVKQERDLFRDQVGALQRENTSLVARLGKISEGRNVLQEIQAEVTGGTRSRSSSIRRSVGVEATALASDPRAPPSK